MVKNSLETCRKQQQSLAATERRIDSEPLQFRPACNTTPRLVAVDTSHQATNLSLFPRVSPTKSQPILSGVSNYRGCDAQKPAATHTTPLCDGLRRAPESSWTEIDCESILSSSKLRTCPIRESGVARGMVTWDTPLRQFSCLSRMRDCPVRENWSLHNIHTYEKGGGGSSWGPDDAALHSTVRREEPLALKLEHAVPSSLAGGRGGPPPPPVELSRQARGCSC